jgi:hypothetical protein
VETFSEEKKRIDFILHAKRNVVVQWWTKETHVSRNKSEVIKKTLVLGIHDENVIHFLIKTQVYYF